tara:strand:+ start:170040 stop:170498 length:459 start_codon:yes stop_codon:yes gene_type:complete
MGQSTIKTGWLDHMSEEMDLRKRREDSIVDRIVRRAHWLEPHDRELVFSMFRDGHSANTISKITGECPRQVRRRIKRLVSRLNDPRVAYVVAHADAWSKSRKAIARSLYIQGRSMRETTDTLGVSFYCVRKNREAIEAMALAPKNTTRTWRS